MHLRDKSDSSNQGPLYSHSCGYIRTYHILVNQVSHKLDSRQAEALVIPAVPLLEVGQEAVNDELAYVGELCVDDGHQSSIHIREGGREALRLDDRAGNKTSARIIEQESAIVTFLPLYLWAAIFHTLQECEASMFFSRSRILCVQFRILTPAVL